MNKPSSQLVIQSIVVRLLLIAFASLAAIAVSSLSMGQSPRDAAPPSRLLVYEGFTEPIYDISVAATEIGRIESVAVKVGQQVFAGQEIAKLEDALQASSVQIAQHQAAMTGELKAAQAEAELQRSRTESLRTLSADGMARPDELIRAETDLRIASARLAAAEEQLQLRKLELRRYQLQLERRKVRVPMNGVISQVFRHPGEYITPGDPAVVQLLVMDTMFAVFNVPVEDTRHIHVGSAARVHFRSTNQSKDAEVSLIAPDIDGESGTVQIRVELDNSDKQLLAGDRCTLHIVPQRTLSNAKLPVSSQGDVR